MNAEHIDRRAFLAGIAAALTGGCQHAPRHQTDATLFGAQPEGGPEEPAGGTGASWDFWQHPRAGANFFNEEPHAARFQAARELGVSFIRLTPSKWRTSSRDFLVGDADDYRGLVEDDFARLRSVLDVAGQAGLRVLLTLLSVPGRRWRQANGGVVDRRLWSEPRYREQCNQFWSDLSERLVGHPAICGYNLLNEPTLPPSPNASEALVTAYDGMVSSIRSADETVPIVIDPPDYASPSGFEGFEPIDDERTIYSLHMYDPYTFTNWASNKGRLEYPYTEQGESIDRDWLKSTCRTVEEWRKRHSIPASRILVGEFGCDHRVPGALPYLRDLVDVFDDFGWHWAFYAFREDSWIGMDYELPKGSLNEEFWNRRDEDPLAQPTRGETPLIKMLRSRSRTRSSTHPVGAVEDARE